VDRMRSTLVDKGSTREIAFYKESVDFQDGDR